jgi:hypothetical protein
MKLLIVCLFFSAIVFAQNKPDQFEAEAKAFASDLKMSLVKNLSDKIAKSGVEEAVPFCHANVKPIAKAAAKDRMDKFEFGRTSHKIRNDGNAPKPWAIQYLKEFEGKKKGDSAKTSIIHQLPDGKRVYMEPLYVEAKCLLCHGENINKSVSDTILKLYPNDKATGFKLGDFRGFIWIKEK